MARPKKNADAVPPPIEDDIEDDLSPQTLHLAVETLTGDIRDFMLDRLKHEQNKRPWHERSEADQRDTVHMVEVAVRDVVTKAVEIIAASGRRTIKAKLAQVVVKDGMKAQLELSRFDELRHALSDSVGKQVLIVVADPDDFTGERAPVEIKADQGDLVKEAMAVHSATDDAPEVPFH